MGSPSRSSTLPLAKKRSRPCSATTARSSAASPASIGILLRERMRSTVPTVGASAGMGDVLGRVGELPQRPLDHPRHEETGTPPVEALEPAAQRAEAQLAHVVRGEALQGLAGRLQERDEDGL